jgi:hypothetical protein
MSELECLQSIADSSHGLLSVARAAAFLVALMWASQAWRDLRTAIREGIF